MNRLLPTLGVLAAFVAAGGCGGDDAASPQPGAASGPNGRPNIVLIVADDLGYADVGFHGSEIPTPNIDKLAREGMLLENFHSAMTCSPTRAMLMSGTDSHLAGLGIMGAPTRPEHENQPGYVGYLNFRVASLADLLADAGYDTYISGKWHLGMDVETGPVARGFRRSFVSLDGAAHLGGWDWRGPQPANYRDGEELVQVGDDFYSTRYYTERMIGFIDEDRDRDRPFFAFLAYTAPHWPLQAPDESIAKFKGRYDTGYEQVYLERFARQKSLGFLPADAEPMDLDVFSPRWVDLDDEQRAIEARRMEVYAAMVSDLDAYIGQFVEYLESIGERDNTLIVFISDNGAESDRRDLRAPIAEHIGREYDHSVGNLGRPNSYVMYGRNWATVSAAPFRGHKSTGFEGGIHVPAFVNYAPFVAPGARSDGFATVMDVLPTFLEIAKTEHPGERYRGEPVLPVMGTSLMPMITGKVAEVHPPDEYTGWELYGHRSVRQGDWKIVWDEALGDDAYWMLFDVSKDFGERDDLGEKMPDRLADMKKLWRRYEVESGVIYVD